MFSEELSSTRHEDSHRSFIRPPCTSHYGPYTFDSSTDTSTCIRFSFLPLKVVVSSDYARDPRSSGPIPSRSTFFFSCFPTHSSTSNRSPSLPVICCFTNGNRQVSSERSPTDVLLRYPFVLCCVHIPQNYSSSKLGAFPTASVIQILNKPAPYITRSFYYYYHYYV